MSATNFETIVEEFTALDAKQQEACLHALMRVWKGSAAAVTKSGKPRKEKKEKDPDAPKRAPTAWNLFTSHVAEILKPLVENERKEREECGEAKLPMGVHLKVAGLLKEKGLAGTATDEQIKQTFEEFLVDPYAMSENQKKRQSAGEKPKAKKAAKEAESDSDSSDSDSSDSESEDEKPAQKPIAKKILKKAAPAASAAAAAPVEAESVPVPPAASKAPSAAALKAAAERRKANAEKNKAVAEATKAAEAAAAETSSVASAKKVLKKAAPVTSAAAAAAPEPKPQPKKEEPKPQPTPEPVKAEAEEEGAEGENWEHDFGSGAVLYQRYPGDESGTYYIFHPTDGYMGLWRESENFLDTSVADPTE